MSAFNSKSLGKESATSAPPLRRRRTKLMFEKKLADDEFMAAAIGDVEWLKQSLKEATSAVNFDKNGLAAIHLAALHGRLECLKLCIEKFKIDVNLPSTTGWRPIHLCISNQTGKRSLQCLIYLLENGAFSSIANDDGITPAHQAASEGHVQCLKILIEIGAKIDSNDCRGNTPLDLAKLWGHRKCARILAAEIWHQDKTFVAKEMLQLKKIKMQKFLKELQEEEKMKAGNSVPEIKSSFVKANDSKEMNTFGDKPNSKSKKTDFIGDDTNKKTIHIDEKLSKQTVDELNKYTLYDEFDKNSLDENGSIVNKSAKYRKSISFYNPDHWNISTKAEENPYLPGLEDDYPRDEYTKMPKVKGAPKYYEGKYFSLVSFQDIDEDIRKKGTSAKLRRPKLSEEVINKMLSKDSSLVERGMIFKCKHIEDVHTKRKYDAEISRCSEAPFHLINDVDSLLIKHNVILHMSPKECSSSSDISFLEK
ncbi:Ankyrin repeat domain-containing protein 53 [Bulinus truncatus]|nr:Ankyrin repeat domain-containing protein 53 [Bulinus truncatus]